MLGGHFPWNLFFLRYRSQNWWRVCSPQPCSNFGKSCHFARLDEDSWAARGWTTHMNVIYNVYHENFCLPPIQRPKFANGPKLTFMSPRNGRPFVIKSHRLDSWQAMRSKFYGGSLRYAKLWSNRCLCGQSVCLKRKSSWIMARLQVLLVLNEAVRFRCTFRSISASGF